MTLAINLATRGRPDILVDTIERTLANISRPDTLFAVSIDDDDTATIDAMQSYMAKDVGVYVSVKPREDSLGAKYNRILGIAPDADVYLAMVDYAPHITPGFDAAILKAAQVYPDGLCVVYNRLANLSFPGINAVTRSLAELMGGMYEEYWPVWYIDHWLNDIGWMTDRIAYCDVEVDLSRRPGTQSLRDLAFWCEFYTRTERLREDVAVKILNRTLDPEWRKRALINNFPLHHQRSRIINKTVVATHGAHVLARRVADEPRFQRLRSNANRVLADIGQPLLWTAAAAA